MGVFIQLASNIKGFVCTFACFRVLCELGLMQTCERAYILHPPRPSLSHKHNSFTDTPPPIPFTQPERTSSLHHLVDLALYVQLRVLRLDAF